MFKIFLGLVHYPVNDKVGDVVTTSVTNMDIHDISRSCRTFGIDTYFLITPILLQHQLVNKILGHWETEKGLAYNPDRSNALSIARVITSFEESVKAIETQEGKKPLIVVTGANFKTNHGSTDKLVEMAKNADRPIYILFGTGWGLNQEILNNADFFLEPIVGMSSDGYNHLSVRSAVAIYLSKLATSLS